MTKKTEFDFFLPPTIMSQGKYVGQGVLFCGREFS